MTGALPDKTRGSSHNLRMGACCLGACGLAARAHLMILFLRGGAARLDLRRTSAHSRDAQRALLARARAGWACGGGSVSGSFPGNMKIGVARSLSTAVPGWAYDSINSVLEAVSGMEREVESSNVGRNIPQRSVV